MYKFIFIGILLPTINFAFNVNCRVMRVKLIEVRKSSLHTKISLFWNLVSSPNSRVEIKDKTYIDDNVYRVSDIIFLYYRLAWNPNYTL